MGGSESLSECLASAENGLEVEDCALDYDELVTGPGGIAVAVDTE